MSQYFAVGVARSADGWVGRELELEDAEDLDTLADLLRDLGEGAAGAPTTALLLLEEDDEYVAIMRVDGDGDPRVFLSDRRAAASSDIAAMLYDEAVTAEAGAEPEADDEDGESRSRPEAEPAGDAALLADLGTPADALLDLCAEEGMLPADVIYALAERAGFTELLEELRGG